MYSGHTTSIMKSGSSLDVKIFCWLSNFCN